MYLAIALALIERQRMALFIRLFPMVFKCAPQQLIPQFGAAAPGLAEGMGQVVVRHAGFSEVGNFGIAGSGLGSNAGCFDARAPIIVN